MGFLVVAVCIVGMKSFTLSPFHTKILKVERLLEKLLIALSQRGKHINMSS